MRSIRLAALLLALPGAAVAQAGATRPAAEARLRPADAARLPFWQIFGDEALAELVRAALAKNGDVRAGWYRVRQADALADQSFARLLPSVNGVVSANVQPLGSAIPGAGADELVTRAQAGLEADWQIDIVGRNTTAWQASKYDRDAARGNRDALALSVATRVADTYFALIEAEQQVEVLDAQLEINRKLLELMELRFESAAATAQEVLQQRQQVASNATLLPQSRQLARTLALQLAVLTGSEPGTLAAVPAVLPEPPPLPAEGIPVELVEARPDLRAALARVDAADLRSSVAVRDLFPSLFVNGQAGWLSTRIADETETDAVWSAAGVLSVPLFAGGANLANIRANRAAEEAAAAEYRQLALVALQEVESAWLRIGEQRAVVEAATTQVEVGRLAYEEAEARYLAGLGNYLAVLTANNAWQQAQLQLVQARRNLLGVYVELYASLGGAWTIGLVPEES